MKVTTPLKQGTEVEANGYKGTIVRLYDAEFGIYEIRLPGGVIATSDFRVLGGETDPTCMGKAWRSGVVRRYLRGLIHDMSACDPLDHRMSARLTKLFREVWTSRHTIRVSSLGNIYLANGKPAP